MSRPTLRRALLIALIAGSAALPAGALVAGSPEIFHGTFSDVFDDVNVCGVTVDVRSEGVFTDKVFFDKDGNFVRFMSTVSGKTTYTAADGEAIIVQFANQFVDGGPIIDEAAGTITFVTTYKGLPEKIQTAGGPVLLRDAGVISFAGHLRPGYRRLHLQRDDRQGTASGSGQRLPRLLRGAHGGARISRRTRRRRGGYRGRSPACSSSAATSAS